MWRVILANGASFDCKWCALVDGILGMNLQTDNTIPQLAAIFGDPANTARITLKYTTDNEDVFEGYTVLRTLSAGGWMEGTTLIKLVKGE